MIEGLGGNDTICGLGGADTIRGGEGDDRLFGGLDSYDYEDYDGDSVEPGPGDDHVDLGHDPVTEELSFGTYTWDQVSFADADGPVTVDLTAGTATGEGTDTIAPTTLVGGVEGSAFDDQLTGSEQIDWITAGGGDDVVDGRGGDDYIQADAPTRRLPSEETHVPGDDVVDGGDGRDEIEGGHGKDVLRGNAGRDTIRVEDGERGTRALGGPGSDGLGSWSFLSTGKALLLGGSGDDTFFPAIADRQDSVVVRGGVAPTDWSLPPPSRPPRTGARSSSTPAPAVSCCGSAPGSGSPRCCPSGSTAAPRPASTSAARTAPRSCGSPSSTAP